MHIIDTKKEYWSYDLLNMQGQVTNCYQNKRICLENIWSRGIIVGSYYLL
jgi:hypothetical protein